MSPLHTLVTQGAYSTMLVDSWCFCQGFMLFGCLRWTQHPTVQPEFLTRQWMCENAENQAMIFLIICGCDSFFFSTLHLPKMECQHCHSPRFFCFCFCPLVWMSIGATQVCPVKERQEQSLHVVVQNLQKQVKFWCELWIMLTLDLFSHGNLMWFATRGVPELHNR